MLEGSIFHPLFIRFQVPRWIQKKTLVAIKNFIDHESHESAFMPNIYLAFLA